VVAAKAFEQPRSGYGAAQVFLGAGLGVVVGAEFSGMPLFVQFLIGGAAGLVVYWGVPTAWAAIGWLRAPIVQRDQAREYARAFETYARDFEQWAARREIAYRFRHETFEDHRRITSANYMGSLSDEEDRWRNMMAQVANQIRDNGGDVSNFMEAQLAALDDADNGYGGDDNARIRNSMLACCQNLLSDMLNQPAPRPPTPPQPEPGPAFQV